MEDRQPLYEGKAKRLFPGEEPNTLIVEYKDSLTAYNAQKKASMEGKGTLNNQISALLFDYLEKNGIRTHYIQIIDKNHQLVKKTKIIPLEVVVRNITTGSICKRLGVPEGKRLDPGLVEFYLKNDDLGDPIVTEGQAVIFGWATREETKEMKTLALKVNDLLRAFFEERNVVLVDFKLEFGRTEEGEMVVADEISPDTCRFWDTSSRNSLDKDRFRKDLGNVLEAYEEIKRRICAGERK